MAMVALTHSTPMTLGYVSGEIQFDLPLTGNFILQNPKAIHCTTACLLLGFHLEGRNSPALTRRKYFQLISSAHNVFGPTLYLSRRDCELGHFRPFKGILEQKLFNKMCSEFNFI